MGITDYFHVFWAPNEVHIFNRNDIYDVIFLLLLLLFKISLKNL